MQAIATTPVEYALNSLKATAAKLNDALYGTPERAQRSVGLSFLALVLVQGYGLLNVAPVVCSM